MTHKTNVEKITDYMKYGSPMNQAFAITAIDRLAIYVVENKGELIKSMDKTFISVDAWVQSAEDWLKISKDL